VPHGQALGFLTFVAPAAFMMSFVEGTVLSVVPIFVVETLGVDNLAVVGLIGFLVLAVGGVAPFVARNLEPRRSVIIGVACSAALSFLIVASSGLDAVGLVVFAAAAIGFINGFILYGGTVIAGTIVPIEERGKLMSLLYTFAYAGTIPTVALGYLADGIGLTGSLLVFSLAATALALFVLLVGRRLFTEVVPYVEPVVVVPPPGEAAPAR
jgi:MFS family permease